VGALGVLSLTVVAVLNAGLPANAAEVSVPASPPSSSDRELATELTSLSDRVREVNDGWRELSAYYDAEVAPIERVLLRYRADTALASRIAVALVREAREVEVQPGLLLAVLLVENPWLEPAIRSPVGAIGLMQVMPVHQGAWAECGADLEDVDSNICHGARIFAMYWERSQGDLDRALLRYNGCVNGTNTPNCHQYPNHVFARAGRASVLSWMNASPGAGSP
jgi:soluble lytic murein transglycosylase-like protein